MTRRLRTAVALVLAGFAGTFPARAGAEEALADLKAGRYLEAVSEIQAVVDRSPGYPYGHFLLGHCLLRMRQIGEAQREFQRALELDATRAEFYQGFAMALNAGGNWPYAIQAASEGLLHTRDPRFRYALLALRSYSWGALGRWSDAIKDLEEVERMRSAPWSLVLLGKSRFAMGDYANAIVSLQRSLQHDSDDPVVLRLLAESYLRLAAAESDPVRKKFNYQNSLSHARRLALLSPNDLGIVQLVGRAALGVGQLDQAESIFRHVLANQPRQCYALADLGRTLMAASRWDEAEAYLLQASACAPRLTAVYESLGEVYLRIGKPKEAAVAFRRAESLEPRRHAPQGQTAIPVFAPR